MNIREATPEDFDRIWPIFHEIAAAGETYAYPPDIGKEQARALWIKAPRKTFVAEEGGQFYRYTEQRSWDELMPSESAGIKDGVFQTADN